MPHTRLTLIRHGHVHNPEDIIYGRLPGFHLSEVGREQVERAAAQLRDADVAAIFSSPQLRAQESAEILRRYHPDLEITTSPLIDEIDCYFEGHPAAEVAARGWDLYTDVGDGYETPPDIAARGARFVANVRQTHAGEHVVAVTHGDVIAFTVLWAMHEPARVALKRTLHRFGVTDTYPATASLTTLTYRTPDPDEIPGVTYARPYDDDLMLASLS